METYWKAQEKEIMVWIQTYTGKVFDLLNPRPEDICVEDIIHSLSNLCRFTGHSSEFYCVGQHCVIVSRLVSPENALCGLLHDASETYLGDVSGPLKSCLARYRSIEKAVNAALAVKFDIPALLPEEVKEWDMRLLLREAELFLGPQTQPWKNLRNYEPADVQIDPMTPLEARHMFMKRFKELTK